MRKLMLSQTIYLFNCFQALGNAASMLFVEIIGSSKEADWCTFG
jgi:hypothetical protein